MNKELEIVLRPAMAAVICNIIGLQRDKSGKAAGVVTGVGFLGAGAIFHHRHFVEVLTTAASMWLVAVIGVASGAGMYIVAPAVMSIALIIVILPHIWPPQ